MTKRSVLTIRVPEDLKVRLERLADSQGVSLNQLALYAFSKEASQLETQMFLSSRVGKKSKNELLKNFDDVLAKVSSRRPLADSDNA